MTALESDSTSNDRATLREVLRTIHQHVEEVEAVDGLLEEMRPVAARVAFRVEKLRREHVELLEQTRDLVGRDEHRQNG